MPYDAQVPKELPVGVRFEPEELAALKAWAKDDRRPVSQFIRKLVLDAMEAAGRFPERPKLGPKDPPAL
jgi:hypothetical protein